MKKFIVLTLAFVFAISINSTFAQDARTIQLEQTKGVFTVQGLTLSEGTYVFEISNNGVDHEVGFVVAPKGKTEAEHHIKEAYVQKTIKDGESSTSKEVTLAKGEYVYFCPLNPTPLYTITVK